jgi:hypothetical protein
MLGEALALRAGENAFTQDVVLEHAADQAEFRYANCKRLRSRPGPSGYQVLPFGLWRSVIIFSPEHFREHLDTEARGTIAKRAVMEIDMSPNIDHPDAEDVSSLFFHKNSCFVEEGILP